MPPPTVSSVPSANVVFCSVTDPALLSEIEPTPSVVIVDAASIEKLESVTDREVSCPAHDSRLSEVPPPTVSSVPSANVVSSSVTDPALLSEIEPLSVVVDAASTEKLESVTDREVSCPAHDSRLSEVRAMVV
eukprot:COSAG02_NODE_9824_length_2100_cov_1.034983_2_plen_133_part_00